MATEEQVPISVFHKINGGNLNYSDAVELTTQMDTRYIFKVRQRAFCNEIYLERCSELLSYFILYNL